MSIQDKIARAKAAPRPTADVPVALRSDVAKRREALLEQIESEEQDPRLSKGSKARKELEALDHEDADSLVTLRFTEMDSEKWADLCAENMARPGVVVDAQFGYNLDAVCRAAAPLSGVVVEDDSEEPLSEDEWADLWTVISPRDFSLVRDAIWGLNEWSPTQRVERLKKVSRRG